MQEWLALVWYVPIVTALAFIWWYAGIKRCQVATAAAFSGMMPFTAIKKRKQHRSCFLL
ncbi:hypothetical protein PVOR_15584 [Paenibacillus vortex V453]|uniref:Uncharacterized protein n=1 Tax=Paenibacillus vortex V453 TaxID=715225 RepID=A0A2R9SUN1_9BACL|nr:hypothetical protein PVOR_15584 [Paenibacillus vortex V453]